MRRICLAAALMLVAWASAVAQNPVTVTGVVFDDRNGNGTRDRGERALKALPVSDGEQVVLTDRRGGFVLQTTSGSSVFAITPSDFVYSGAPKNAGSAFLYILPETAAGCITHDIALSGREPARSFRVGAIGDVQVKDAQELNYAGRTVFAELAGRGDIDFNIFLGDQVNDDTSLFPHIAASIDALPMPSWSVAGNHDRSFRAGEPHDRDFNTRFGASHYSFNYGDVHFIVLNNVYSEDGRRDYVGFVPERQLRFIANDLALVPPGRTVVLCQHIPMAQTRNRDEVLALLSGRERVLILSGHTHQVGRHILAPNVQELTAGATCGSWWVGERDAFGVPFAMMQCGAPRGYFTVDFSDGGYTFRYKGVGLDSGLQMDIWTRAQDTANAELEGLQDIPADLVVANIYGGSDSTRVMLRVDGGEWMPMERSPMVAPAVARTIAMNRAKAYPTKYSRRIPFRRQSSPHIWTASLPDSLSGGLHAIDVRACDSYGFSAEGSTIVVFPE